MLSTVLKSLTHVSAEDAAAADGAAADGEEKPRNLLEELTINMASEAVDARTFMVRDTAGKGYQHIRLGNVKVPEKGSMSDEEYQEKLDEAKSALAAFVDKQMIFWKPAPDELQPKDEGDKNVVLADAWTIDGRHITSMLTKAGHLHENKEYENELARDILSAEADERKKEQYKKLEEALKESNDAKAAAAEEEEEEQAEDDSEPIGVGGWIGLIMIVALVLGTATNFGKGWKKRTNPNKKRGFIGNLLAKFKLA